MFEVAIASSEERRQVYKERAEGMAIQKAAEKAAKKSAKWKRQREAKKAMKAAKKAGAEETVVDEAGGEKGVASGST
jgi:hypothetical protein